MEVKITDPIDVAKLPHLTTIHRLEIIGISPKCADWQWIKDITHLRELYLHIKDTTTVEATTVEANYPNKLLVHGRNTSITINDVGTADLIGQVLEYLPTYLRDGVSFQL